MSLYIYSVFVLLYVYVAALRLAEALCYKPEGRRFMSRMRWIFSIYLILPAAHYGPGVDSVSNKNEYQESSWR
jgi:hypothetical protein